MHMVLIIMSLILLVFGGGCTLILVGGGLTASSSNILADVPLLLTILVPFGILPAIIGWLLFRWGLGISRRKREAAPAGTVHENTKR